MKIAFVVNEFPALSETFVLNQIVGLIKLDYEVDIYASRPRKESKLHPDVEKYDLLSRTYYAVSMPNSRFARLLKAISLFLSNFPKAPLVMLRVLKKLFNHKQKSGSLKLLCNVIPLLNKGLSYDIVYCHFGTNGLKAAQLKNIGAVRGKLITVFHGGDISSYLQKAGERAYNDLFKMLDLALPISEFWQKRLINLGCDRQKILVHRMGINCQKFPFTLRVPYQNNSIRIVTIGRLVEKKGIEYGIRAVAELAAFFPSIKYQIVGDGVLRTQLEELIQKLGVASQVELLGWKQQTEVKEILDRADIFLAPSVTSKQGSQEGIPVALMEAMAMGLPVLSTLHTGIPELVENNVSGFLVPERDVDALAQKLRYLIEHPQLWGQMGKAGHTFVQEDYNIDKLNRQLIKIFEQLVN